MPLQIFAKHFDEIGIPSRITKRKSVSMNEILEFFSLSAID